MALLLLAAPPEFYNSMRKLLLIGSVVLFVGLVLLVILAEFFSSTPRRFTEKLDSILPGDIAGWVRRDIPLTSSSAELANVRGILNFNQAAQVLYTKGNQQVLVYVAYWEPGKIAVADAGTHNPDSCWVNAGCTRTEREYSVDSKVGTRALKPYEYGQYAMPQGGKQNVVFWHLVNGEPHRYQGQQIGWRDGLVGRIERMPLVLKDFRKYGLNQKNEQMFIRVSSFYPIKDLLTDSANEPLFTAFEKLGIFQGTEWK
jgi:hypothetical protein